MFTSAQMMSSHASCSLSPLRTRKSVAAVVSSSAGVRPKADMRISSFAQTFAVSVHALFFVAYAEETKPLWLACGSADLLKAIEPLVEYRRGEGFEILLSSLPPDEALTTASRRPDYLLIVGDDLPRSGDTASPLQAWQVRTKWLPFYKWIATQEPQFACDFA